MPTADTPPSDDIPGTTVFTPARSRQGYRLNKLASTLTKAENRKRFLADETAYRRAMSLTDTEIDLVRRRDWSGIIAHGGNIYVMSKIAATVGQTLLQMGAQMRGETVEQFMATRPGLKGKP